MKSRRRWHQHLQARDRLPGRQHKSARCPPGPRQREPLEGSALRGLLLALALHAAAAVFAPSKGCRIARPAHASMSRLALCARCVSLSLAAMALWLVMPLRLISSMMGRDVGCKSPCICPSEPPLPRFATSAMSGLPRRFPRLLAAIKSVSGTL